MKIRVEGARENNLKDVTVEFNDGLTVVTGISGSGKTSLVCARAEGKLDLH